MKRFQHPGIGLHPVVYSNSGLSFVRSVYEELILTTDYFSSQVWSSLGDSPIQLGSSHSKTFEQRYQRHVLFRNQKPTSSS